jgi:thymidylate synthase ThyX
MDDEFFEKPYIGLIAFLHGGELEGLGPEEIVAFGARGCFDQKTPIEIYLQHRQEKSGDGFEEGKEKIFSETSGRGHGAVLDQSCFVFNLGNIPRMVTLQLCCPEYLAHMQQSLRRADADKGFYLPKQIGDSPFFDKTAGLLREGFLLYEEMKQNGIPGEDARYVLSLLTRTNIQSLGDARELMHLHQMSRKGHMPTIISETIEGMVSQLRIVAPRLFEERGPNYEVLSWFPSAQPFALENEVLKKLVADYGGAGNGVIQLDSSGSAIVTRGGLEKAIGRRDEAELANLKHVHYTFFTGMSLACFHQAIRQRTWNQSVEPIYDAVKNKRFVTPPSVLASEKHWLRYGVFHNRTFDLSDEMVEFGIPQQEAVGVIPHSLIVHDLIHVNGWNAIHSIGKRTCTEAQWEIRGKAREMADLIREDNPVLGEYVQPQGVTYGKCPERKSCGYCERVLAKRS